MSVRVNLLPQEQAARQAAARQRTGALAGGVVLLLALVAGYWWASGQVADAEDRLLASQQETATLRAEVNDLAEFRDLADRRDSMVALLSTLLADEASLAGLMQDMAAVIPSDSQLETFTLTLETAEEEPVVAEDAEGLAIGTLSLTGKTLQAHAPGVERFLLEFDKVASFRDLYVSSSALDDPTNQTDRVATFSVEAAIGPEARTGRYLAGLPEELR